MKTNVKELIKPIVVLFLIAAVMAALLGGTNLLTKNKIAALEKKSTEQAVAKVIESDKADEKTVNYNGLDYTYYEAQKDAKTVGYAFKVSENGYGGAVSCVVGIKLDGTISAVEITDVSNETPGLGQNAKKESFYKQFADKKGQLEVTKNTPADNQVKAVTGATITSRAATKAVNKATELFEYITKEAK